MDIVDTPLLGLKIITPARYGDDRGFFSESYNRAQLANQGIEIEFVQDNHSVSGAVGTVRGLHFQAPPHAQSKFVRCGRGCLWDVAVDIRVGSPSFGKWFGIELTPENGHQLLIPVGFLHGFVTREPDTEIIYKCSDYYAPDCDGAVLFDDPAIGINWDISRPKAIISEKDAAAPLLADLENPFVYEPPTK